MGNGCYFSRRGVNIHTRPFSLIGIAKVLRCRHKHLNISYWGPERNHVVLPIVANGCVLQGVDSRLYQWEWGAQKTFTQVCDKHCKDDNQIVHNYLSSFDTQKTNMKLSNDVREKFLFHPRCFTSLQVVQFYSYPVLNLSHWQVLFPLTWRCYHTFHHLASCATVPWYTTCNNTSVSTLAVQCAVHDGY